MYIIINVHIPHPNHPPSVIKHIEFRINANSSSKEVFNKHCEFYNAALRNNSYKL